MQKDPIKMIMECKAQNEPSFTIRAKDKCSVIALKAYLDACDGAGCDSEYCKEIEIMLNNFTQYQKLNPIKIPD